ncbi:MAG: Hpt domain-containing protein [Bacillota bacterium]|nr:Hpt domain-containing protein [Bacillota bacterium]
MEDFKKFFTEYGIDYETTMERFLNNKDTYLRLLKMFFADDNLAKLSQALAAGNLDAAFEAAHTLKGVCGNLGLSPMYDKICDIVEPLRRKEDRNYIEQFLGIEAEFKKLEELCKKYFQLF